MFCYSNIFYLIFKFNLKNKQKFNFQRNSDILLEIRSLYLVQTILNIILIECLTIEEEK